MFELGTLRNSLTLVRNGALILLMLEGLVVATAALVMLWPLVRSLRRLRRSLPGALQRAQLTTSKAKRGVQQAAGLVCAPFFWLEQVSAKSRSLAERLRAALKSGAPKRR